MGEWPSYSDNAHTQLFIEASSKPHDIVIRSDVSVPRDQPRWRFTVKKGGRNIHENNGDYRVTAYSLTMEAEAAT